MSWRYPIAFVALIVLTALPVAATVCAIECAPAAAASAHHGSGQRCDDLADASTAIRIAGASVHDCSAHDAAVPQSATIAARRADSGATTAPSIVYARHQSLECFAKPQPVFADAPLPGAAPPTPPLVLRI